MEERGEDVKTYVGLGKRLDISEEELANLYLTMPLGVVYQDSDGNIISANPAAEEILGLSLDQMEGRTSMDPRWRAVREDGSDFPGDEHPAMVALRTGEEVRDVVMAVFNPRNEAYTWIEITAVPQFLPGQDRPYQVYATFRDITVRKKAEEALKESESRFRAAFENTSVGASMVGLDGRFIMVNDALCRMLGYPEEELLTKTFSDITYPEDVKIGEDASVDMQSGKKDRETLEKRYIRKDGEMIYGIVSPSIIRDDEGKPKYFVGLWQDVTERKKAEDALRESEEWFRNIYDSAADGVLLLELDPEKGPAIINANLAALNMHGYTKDELVGQPISFLDSPKTRDQIPERTRGILKEEKVVFETEHARKDGSVFPLEVSAQLFEVGGKQFIISNERDITERKKTEEELKEATARLETLVGSISDLVAFKDTQGRHLVVNKALEKFMGMSKEELLGKEAEDIFPPEVAEQCRRSDEEAMRSPVPLRSEEKVGEGDGLVILDTIKSPIADENGNVIGMAMVSRDITERKKAEYLLAERARLGELGSAIGTALTTGETLRDSLQRCTQAIVNHLDVAFARIWTVNPDENILELKASAGMYTHLDGEHSRIPVGELKIGTIAKDGQPHLTNEVIGDPRITDQEWARREGMVAFAGQPLKVEDRVVGVIGVFSQRPLTEDAIKSMSSIADEVAIGVVRRMAEEALQEAIDRFQTVLDSIDAVIYVADMETYELLFMNKYAIDSFGDGTGKKCWAAIQEGQTGPCDFCNNDKLVDDKGSPVGPVVWEFKNTVTGRWYLITDKAIPWKGRRLVRLEIAMDITDRKLAADRAELFGDILRHDVMNPLNVVGLYSDFLLESEVDPEKVEHLETLKQSLEEAVHLIEEAGKLSKLESVAGMEMEKMDLKTIIDSVVEDFQPLAEEAGVRIENEIDSSIPIRGNWVIDTVFGNLISNAIKYAPEGERIVVGSEEEPKRWKVWVKDYGEGIENAHKQAIFERYERKEKGAVKGTGLGLAIAKRIVDIHGGEIWVEDNPEGGSVFFVRLPKAG